MKDWFENTKAGVTTWIVSGVLIALAGVSWIVTSLADGRVVGIVLGGLLILAGSRTVFKARQALLSLGSRSSEGDD